MTPALLKWLTAIMLVMSQAKWTEASFLRHSSGERALADFVQGVADRANNLFRTGSRLSGTIEDGGLRKLVEIHRAPRVAPSLCPGDSWVEGLMGCIDEDDSQDALLTCIACPNLKLFRKCDRQLGSYLGYCETCAIASVRDNFAEECKLCTLSPKQMYEIKRCRP